MMKMALILLLACYAVCIRAFKNIPFKGFARPHHHTSLCVAISDSAAAEAATIDVRKFSSSSGAALDLSAVALSIGNNDILSGVDWSLYPNERWALVGPNGAGKSTLLRALTGTGGKMINIREGDVTLAKNRRMGYLEQKGVSDYLTDTVRQAVLSGMERLATATTAYEEAEARLSGGDCSDEAMAFFEEASTEYEAAGGYTVEQKIGGVLKGLGFLETDYDRLCSEFSGGWQMRIALARLLLSEPDLLILDEPTNHLDKGAKDWLANYLSRYEGTLLVVSHDTNLLDNAVNSIAEVRGGTIELYKSRTHAQWLTERDERVERAQAAFEKNQEEIARLQGFVDRFGAKTMGASMAQSRLKQIEKLEKDGPAAPQVGDGPKPSLKLPKPPAGTPKDLLSLTDVDLRWEEQLVISGINMKFEKGMRIAVRGPNGAGKSTLLSGLTKKLTVSSGQRVEGDNLAMGVFTQDLAQDLDQKARAVDVVTAAARQFDPTISDETARGVLGALGLRGEKALRIVGHLSGGEKARVALASFVLIPSNFLLWDEPTNHLDKATVNTLVEALATWQGGAILCISHDRPFLEKLNPTHVLTVRGGRAILEERGLREEDWLDALNSRAEEAKLAPAPVRVAAATSVIGGNKEGKSKGENESEEQRKKRFNAPKRVQKIENSLAKLEAEVAEIDVAMLEHGRDLDRLKELQRDKDEKEQKCTALWAEMEELDALLK
jgi:ATPase subunit of ABC transporter with duplicated ATPase domains